MACAMVSIVHLLATTTTLARVGAALTVLANRAVRARSPLGCGSSWQLLCLHSFCVR
jgi:hypothetical protein